jgi:uridine kinase
VSTAWIRSTQREELLRRIAREVASRWRGGVLRVAIDGVDGAGKTTFADELAAVLELPAIRASIDSFHNPRAVRYRRGRDSPVGFYRDSFDLDTLRRELLDPLSPGGDRRYRRAAFDHTTDRVLRPEPQQAPEPSALVLDGIFLHRPELRGYWDYSVFLQVERVEALRRCCVRDGRLDAAPTLGDPEHRRYVEGQNLYLAECAPQALATRVIDNTDLASPSIHVD